MTEDEGSADDFFGSLTPYLTENKRLGACPVEVLLAIDLERESHLIDVAYFQAGLVFPDVSTQYRIAIIERWIQSEDEMSLSILAYLINQLIPGCDNWKRRERYFSHLRSKISDPDALENLSYAATTHSEMR